MSPALALVHCAAGETVHVVRLTGGRRLQQRLTGMGIMPGSGITVLQGGRGKRSALLVACGETRLMIGHGMAEKILVRRTDS